MQSNPKISVVIPVKNGAPWLDGCIKGIMSQTLFAQAEIIAIDSGSTDESMAILKKHPVRIYSIPTAEFNHGLTRNYGAELSRGDYVVMTVQDARPADDQWLQRLLDGFSVAENVAGVCGSQVVPHDRDKNPMDWFRPIDEPAVEIYQFKKPEDFSKLSPSQKAAACGWDDVTAMYKKKIFLQMPFQKVSCHEDGIWAKEALLAGFTLVYNNAAKVYHYHHGNAEFSFHRSLTVMHLRYKHFGCTYNQRPRQSFRQSLSLLKTIFKSEPLTIKEKWKWFIYNRQQLKGQKKAYDIFSAALNESEEKLDAVHEAFCGRPQLHQKRF